MKRMKQPCLSFLFAKRDSIAPSILLASALFACFTGCAASPGPGRYKVFEAFGVPYYYAPREIFTRNSALSAREGAGAMGRVLLGEDPDQKR